jgi:peptidoglycan/xylan/chitin deacetylase (PgdA/CDA1 family)
MVARAVTLPVLLYHGVGEPADPRFAPWVVSPACFAEQMDLLVAEGYRTLTATEAVEHLRRHPTATHERVVAITFDDGFAEVHGTAWPQLRRRGLTATVYVTTGYVGATSRWLQPVGEAERPMLDWDQIAELSDAGIEIGAHSVTHPQLDAVSLARATDEIDRSRDMIVSVLGPICSFAYPHGYHTAAVRRRVQRAGFQSAFAVGNGIASAADDDYAITRVVVDGDATIDDFARLVAGQVGRAAHRPVRRAAWRAVRRAGGEPLAERLRSAGAAKAIG